MALFPRARSGAPPSQCRSKADRLQDGPAQTCGPGISLLGEPLLLRRCGYKSSQKYQSHWGEPTMVCHSERSEESVRESRCYGNGFFTLRVAAAFRMTNHSFIVLLIPGTAFEICSGYPQLPPPCIIA